MVLELIISFTYEVLYLRPLKIRTYCSTLERFFAVLEQVK